MPGKASVLLAATLAGPATALAAEPALPGAGLLQVVGSLFAVVVLIFLLAWGLKRMQSGGTGTGGAIRVISALPMGTRERVVLIQVGEEQILVGIGPGGMRTLHVLDEPLAADAGPDGHSLFAARLRGMLGGSGQ